MKKLPNISIFDDSDKVKLCYDGSEQFDIASKVKVLSENFFMVEHGFSLPTDSYSFGQLKLKIVLKLMKVLATLKHIILGF